MYYSKLHTSIRRSHSHLGFWLNCVLMRQIIRSLVFFLGFCVSRSASPSAPMLYLWFLSHAYLSNPFLFRSSMCIICSNLPWVRVLVFIIFSKFIYHPKFNFIFLHKYISPMIDIIRTNANSIQCVCSRSLLISISLQIQPQSP